MKPRKLRKLYKFTNKQFVPGMIERGVIRISTVQEMRKPDGRDGARSDPLDASIMWQPGKARIKVTSEHPFIKAAGLKMEEGKHVFLECDESTQLSVFPNGYLYSTSWEITNNLKTRMAEEFDADACVCIRDIEGFMRAISAHPLLNEKQWFGDFVTYVDTKKTSAFHDRFVFEKEKKFGWQKEFRFVWSDGVSDADQVIEVPEIVRMISRVF